MMRYLSARLAQQVCLYEPFVPVTFGWTDYLPFWQIDEELMSTAGAFSIDQVNQLQSSRYGNS